MHIFKQAHIFFTFSLLLMSIIPGSSQILETVPHVDLNKYAGKWYEIASFPQRFQKGCQCTTAQYTVSEEGFVIVENRCMRNGKESYIKGKAFVDKSSGNAKLQVRFFWPLKGKYWIIELASDYAYAVVGHPNRKYLWILSRLPEMDDSLYQQILERIEKKGFDINKLNKTVQNCN